MNILLKGHTKDLGGFNVKRLLPNATKRMIGPFIFMDHMGPASFEAGDGIDVRPHPHIGLSTITYMMEGNLLHRDSLGNSLEILPGDVNWMTAGRGIVHSERQSIETKASSHTLNGMQCWLALPKDKAEIEPSFTHVKKDSLPHQMFDGITFRLIAGQALGMSSPIKTYSPMFYMDVLMRRGRSMARPNPAQECLVYILDGQLNIDGVDYEQGQAVILDQTAEIRANVNARCLLLGGDEWPEVPHIYWNFVSFDEQRIEQAKRDWLEQKFPKISLDQQEFIPLPN